MRMPDVLETLVDHGIIQEIVRPLKSGKEAQVYLVESNGVHMIAKVYKESEDRTFRHRSSYTEGRLVRNTRDMRAMKRNSAYGKGQSESQWRSAEVDIIYRLRHAGVRVPEPHNFIDGVLLMELICDQAGEPAPRLGEVHLSPDEAQWIFDSLLRDVVQMLCAGVVHGDLSDFNVLLGAEGPVIIDFPQAVDAAKNQNARRILLRDVENLNRFLTRWVPGRSRRPFAEEMWELFKRGELRPDTLLSGKHRGSQRKVDIRGVMSEIQDANQDEQRRRDYQEEKPKATGGPRARRREVVVNPTPAPESRRQTASRGGSRARGGGGSDRHRDQGRGGAGPNQRPRGSGSAQRRSDRASSSNPSPARDLQARPDDARTEGRSAAAGDGEMAPKRRRRRRRPRGDSDPSTQPATSAPQAPRPPRDSSHTSRDSAPKETRPREAQRSGGGEAAPAQGEGQSKSAKRRRRRKRRPAAPKSTPPSP